MTEIPQNIQEQFSIHFVETMDEVLKVALESPVQVLEEAPEDIDKYKAAIESDYSKESVTH